MLTEKSNGYPKILNSRQLANYITISRSLCTIPIIWSLSIGYNSIAWVLFLIASLSDFIDGWLARYAGGGSRFGAIMDPLADKLLVVGPIIWLCKQSIIPIWAISIFICRELIVSNWRSTKSEGGPANISGKLKTVLQFTSILLMMWPSTWGSYDLSRNICTIGYYLFWPALTISILSAITYLIPRQVSRP